MTTKSKSYFFTKILIIMLAAIFSGCTGAITEVVPESADEPDVELANPASVYCQDQGFTLELRSDDSGGQKGICIFPDGNECEEWAFFRNECSWEEKIELLPDESGTRNSQTVIAWTGHVSSTPKGSQYDDYLLLMPEGTGGIGLQGENPMIEDEIYNLRDGTGADEYATFWGELDCDVDDYGGCQLIVTKLLAGPEQSKPETVEEWAGVIVCSHFNTTPDDECGNAFVLSGNYPMWYGIWSRDPEILAQINASRDTGQIIVVSGQLLAGVPDVNGTQIQVERINIANP